MRRYFLILVSPLLAIGLVACGGNDDADETPTPSASETASSTAPAASPTTVDPTPTVAAGGFQGSTDAVTVAATPTQPQVTLVAVRAAKQEGFDRIVFEFTGGPVPGYAIEYAEAAIACGSGQDLTEFIGSGTKPPALMTIRLEPAVSHDEAGAATAPRDLAARLDTITRAFRTCDFEGVVEYGVALTAEQPFAVSTLENPSRLVIDIAQ